jgi:ribosomal protein S18 acetylase RimI-like enzyme
MLLAIGDLRRRRKPPPASPARFDGWGIIESLYVAEAERRQGLATHLVAAIREELAAMGATRIEISVMVANEPAMAFWCSQGFGRFRVHMIARIENDHQPVTNRADEPGSWHRRGGK